MNESAENWLHDSVLAWTAPAQGITLCGSHPEPDQTAGRCRSGEENGRPSTDLAIDSPEPGFGHLSGLTPLLRVLVPQISRRVPDLLARHEPIASRLIRAAGMEPGIPPEKNSVATGFVPVSEVAALGTTRRISRESHASALWIDRAARFLAEAVPVLSDPGPAAGPVRLDLHAFGTWDRLSIRILYRAVLIAHLRGTPFLVHARLTTPLTPFLASLSSYPGVRASADAHNTRGPAPAVVTGLLPAGGPGEVVRSVGEALALQNFERADLLIEASLRQATDRDERADLIRLRAIGLAQTGATEAALEHLETALATAHRPELRAHLNYLCGLLLTKRSGQADRGGLFYAEGLRITQEQPEAGAQLTVEAAWLHNGLALLATMRARQAGEGAPEREALLREAFQHEFTAFRMVGDLPGDSAFYLRYNLSHNLAFLLQIAGRHLRAEQMLRSVSGTMLSTGRADFLLLHSYAIGILQLRREAYDEALSTFAEAARTAQELADPFYLERTLAAAGYTALRAGFPERAVGHYRQGARVARRIADDAASQQHVAGLLWSLTLVGTSWDADEQAAAIRWYPGAARAHQGGRRSGRAAGSTAPGRGGGGAAVVQTSLLRARSGPGRGAGPGPEPVSGRSARAAEPGRRGRGQAGLMAVLPPLSPAQADALAQRVLDRCHEAGVVGAEASAVDWCGFHALRARLRATFDVPTTTLTPLAARVLYGLSALHRPASIAVLGCYAGNLMAWTCGPVLGPESVGVPGARALGLDVDAEAVRTAGRNFTAAGFGAGLRVVRGDAFDAATHATGTSWDLLLIDIDVPGARKSGYARLLERWLDHRAPGAVVVAHDVCHPAFGWDLGGYPDFVREKGASVSLTLPIDACGLEVSRWPG